MNLFERRHRIFFVGIKGTGMSTLAIQMQSWGHRVSGSDIAEEFYTDAILHAQGIPIHTPFDSAHIDTSIDLVIFSPAYNEEHGELKRAAALGIQTHSYNEMLGILSREMPSLCIAGVHGKSSTVSLAIHMAKSLSLQVCGIAGAYPVADTQSLISEKHAPAPMSSDFGAQMQIPDFGIFEACEYKYNFLSFSPKVLIITAIELDHNDVFPDYDSIERAFLSMLDEVQENGCIVLCAEDKGCRDLAKKLNKALLAERKIRILWYGNSNTFAEEANTALFHDAKDAMRYELLDEHIENQRSKMEFTLAHTAHEQKSISAELSVCGASMALNTLAAYAGLQELYYCVTGKRFTLSQRDAMGAQLASYRGIKRRSELYGVVGGIWILDDYAHHPTAIRKTLAALKKFYNPQNIVVDFMAHTYTRTEALLDAFAQSFEDADVVIVNDIYASAREQRGAISGEILAQEIAEYNNTVCFKPDLEEAALCALSFLHPGDLFVSLGAGQSWQVARSLLNLLSNSSGEKPR